MRYLDSQLEYSVPVITPPPNIYGVKFDQFPSITKGTRTNDAANLADPTCDKTGITSSPFDNISPWKDLVVETRDYNNVMVKIPKYYYRWIDEGTACPSLQIANEPIEGFFVSPAHTDRGDGKGERDVVYIGKYISDYDTDTSKLKSLNSSTKTTDLSYDVAHTNSTYGNFHSMDWATWWTVLMLYLVECTDWNSLNFLRYTYPSTPTYRNIENIYEKTWVEGIRYESYDVYTTLNPNEFSSNFKGKLTGVLPTQKGFSSNPTSFAISNDGAFQMILPETLSDYHDYSKGNAWRCGGSGPLVVGCCWIVDDVTDSGIFAVDLGDNWRTLSRIMELPDNRS